MGVHADSAVVYHRHTGAREVEGRIVNYAETSAYRIALHPLRRIDGEPCPPPDVGPQERGAAGAGQRAGSLERGVPMPEVPR